MSLAPTGINISLTFDLGPRHFRIWSDPLYRNELTIQELEPGAPTLQLTFQRHWSGFDPELIVKRAIYVVTSADYSRNAQAETQAEKSSHSVHYLPPRQAAGHRDDCPTCHGFALAYRRNHNDQPCPGCNGTGVERPKPIERAARRKPLSLEDIGL